MFENIPECSGMFAMFQMFPKFATMFGGVRMQLAQPPEDGQHEVSQFNHRGEATCYCVGRRLGGGGGGRSMEYYEG